MNVKIGAEVAQFLFKEYINGIFVAVRAYPPTEDDDICARIRSLSLCCELYRLREMQTSPSL